MVSFQECDNLIHSACHTVTQCERACPSYSKKQLFPQPPTSKPEASTWSSNEHTGWIDERRPMIHVPREHRYNVVGIPTIVITFQPKCQQRRAKAHRCSQVRVAAAAPPYPPDHHHPRRPIAGRRPVRQLLLISHRWHHSSWTNPSCRTKGPRPGTIWPTSGPTSPGCERRWPSSGPAWAY